MLLNAPEQLSQIMPGWDVSRNSLDRKHSTDVVASAGRFAAASILNAIACETSALAAYTRCVRCKFGLALMFASSESVMASG